MSDPFFFGYGSLVNRSTHGYTDAHPATATGWRRTWRHTTLHPAPFLTAEPDPDCTIEGLIAAVPGADWSALDARETGYDRVPAAHQVTHPLDRPLEIAIYTVPPDRNPHPQGDLPILLSYLDVVIQGYLQEFGAQSAQKFFDTTTGWDSPVLDDRKDPQYPRHQQLSRTERAVVDDGLAALGITPLRR